MSSNTVSDKKCRRSAHDAARRRREGSVDRSRRSQPSPERVPVTEAHRKGVIDPMSAAHHSGRRQGRRADAGSLQAQARDLRRAPARRHRARVQAHGPREGRQGLSGPGRGLHRAVPPDRRTSPGAARDQVSDRAARDGNVAGADRRHARAGAVPLLGADAVRARRAAGELFRRQPAQPTQALRQTPASAKTQ